MRFAALRILILATASSKAVAMVPASSEELLCIGSHVFVGTFNKVEVTPQPCSDSPSRICHCDVQATVQVVEVLGETLDIPPALSPGSVLPISWTHGVPFIWTCENVPRTGSQSLISVSAGYLRGSVVVPHSPPYSARVWPIDKIEWAKEVIQRNKGESCPAK